MHTSTGQCHHTSEISHLKTVVYNYIPLEQRRFAKQRWVLSSLFGSPRFWETAPKLGNEIPQNQGPQESSPSFPAQAASLLVRCYIFPKRFVSKYHSWGKCHNNLGKSKCNSPNSKHKESLQLWGQPVPQVWDRLLFSSLLSKSVFKCISWQWSVFFQQHLKFVAESFSYKQQIA